MRIVPLISQKTGQVSVTFVLFGIAEARQLYSTHIFNCAGAYLVYNFAAAATAGVSYIAGKAMLGMNAINSVCAKPCMCSQPYANTPEAEPPLQLNSKPSQVARNDFSQLTSLSPAHSSTFIILLLSIHQIPHGRPRSRFNDIALRDCQHCRVSRPYRDAQDRLLWRDKTCPAHTELIMSQKSLKLLYCYCLVCVDFPVIVYQLPK